MFRPQSARLSDGQTDGHPAGHFDGNIDCSVLPVAKRAAWQAPYDWAVGKPALFA